MLAPTILFAQSSYERELKQLGEQRDKALAAAAQPINRNYQAALQNLLLRASQNKDVAAVSAIADALKAIAVATETPAAATASMPSDTRQYEGTWRIATASGRFIGFRTLNPDGTALDGATPGSSWKIVGNKLNIIKRNGGIDSFDLPLHGDKLNGQGDDKNRLTLTKVK
jgi:hypothetical protein